MKEFLQKKSKVFVVVGIVVLLLVGAVTALFLNRVKAPVQNTSVDETKYEFQHLALNTGEELNNHNDIGVMIMDCDSSNGFVNYGGITFTSKKGAYVQGKGAMNLTNLRYKDVTPWAKLNPVDISSCAGGSIHVSFYISDPAFLGEGNVVIELTSGGNCDIDEMSWSLDQSNLKAGWNELYLGIADASKVGKPDLTKINFFRMYAKGAKMGLEIMVDAIYATNTPGTWVKPPVQTATTKPGYLLDFDTLKGISSSGTISLADKNGTYKEGVAALCVKNPTQVWAQTPLTPVDLSAFAEDGRLTIWVYVNNADYLKNGIMWIEISSSGTYDKDELSWGIEGKQLKTGWNELTFNMKNAGHTGEIDMKNVNFIRIYGTKCEKELEVILDAVKVWKPQIITPENGMLIDGESLDVFFKINSDIKVVSDNVKQGSGALERTTTGDWWFACSFKDYIDITKFSNGGLHVWLYVEDTSQFKSTVTIELTSSGTYDKDEYSWAISGLKNGWNELLLPFADASVVGTPNLGKLNYMRIFALKTGEVTFRLDDVRAVMDATEQVPSGTTVDTAVEGMIYSADSGLYSKASGTGNYEITREKGEYLQGTGAFKNVGVGISPLTVRLKQPKDISDYKDGALQASIYVKDKSILKSKAMYLELTSSATYDAEELQWYIGTAGLSEGWNVVTLEFNKASKKGEIDYSQVDFIRVHMGETETDKNAMLIFDNIHAISSEELEELKQGSSIPGMLLDCDSMQSATLNSNSGLSVTMNEGEYLQGTGALKTTGKGQIRLMALLNRAYDISAYKSGALEMSVYINDVDLLVSERFIVELTSSGKEDSQEMCWRVDKSKLSDGWNTLTLDFATASTTQGPIDYTEADYLRLYFNKVEPSADLVCIFDDIHVVSEDGIGSAMISELIYNCDSIDDVTLDSDGTISVTERWDNVMEGAGAIEIENTTLVWLSSVFETKNLTDYAGGGIRFWLNVSDLKLLTGSPQVTVELGSAGKADVAEYEWKIANASLQNGWQEIYLDFASADVVGDVDLSQINWFRIFGGANEGLTIMVDDIRASMQETEVCSYLQNNAVYQAEEPLSIWGSASIGVNIKAELYQGTSLIATESLVTTDNEWSLELPEQQGGYTEYSVKVYENDVLCNEATGILFGEVWLAAGQSNMQLKLRDSYDGAKQQSEANDNYLRVFQATSMPEGTGARTTAATDITGTWLLGDNGTKLGETSAVAYNFALVMREELDVPVAILETSMGSTPIEAWLSKEMVDTDDALKSKMQNLGVYKTPTAYTDLGAMYYSKIAPLTNANIAGVIWYQGESNAGRSSIYAAQLDLLKEQWGAEFGFENDSMPFVFTQLAPYSFSGSTNQMLLTGMMDAMSEFYLAHEDSVAMVTNYDITLRYTDTTVAQAAVIHPTVKRPIGERMAKAALGLVYGKDEATAPTLDSVEIADGVAVLKFEHVGTGLTLCNDSIGVLGFALCGEDGIWVNADAEIVDGTTVHVFSDFVDTPVYVSYAYCDMNTDANLCASSGIPAAPFKTGGTGGFGSRSYLNCDEDDFIVTSFATANNEVGHGEYKNLWTILNRMAVSYDEDTHVQGIASVKGVYEAGTDEAVLGIDLTDAGKYSVTAGLRNMGAVAVRMKNGDAREKSVRLCLETSDGVVAYTSAKILEANADFATLVFDLTRLCYEDGSVVENYVPICINMRKLSFCITDEDAGSIWIDDIKLDAKINAEDEDVAVMLLDCDSKNDATITSESALTVTTATGEYLQGGGAFKTTGKGQVRLAAKLNESKDISAYQTGGLELSVYINDKTLLNSTNLKVELTSGGQADKNEMCWTKSLEELSNGWNTLRLDFDMTLNNSGGLDYTKADFIRVYFNKGENNENIVVIIDDIHVYEKEDVVVPGIILNCDDTNNVTLASSGTLSVTTTANEFQQGSGAYKSVNPSLIWFRGVLTETVDVSAYNTGGIHLWMYINDPTLITDTNLKIEFSSNETDDHDEYQWNVPVASLKSGWQELYLEFEGMTGTINLSKIKRIRIYANTNTGLTVMLDDVRAVEEIVSEEEVESNVWYIVNTDTEITSTWFTKSDCNLQLNKTSADEENLTLYVTLDISQEVYDKLQAGHRFVVEIAQTTNDRYEYEFRFPLEDIDLKVGENVLAMTWDRAAETADAKGTGTPSLDSTMNFCKLYYQNYSTGAVSLKGTTVKEIKIVYDSPETEYSIVNNATEITGSWFAKSDCNLDFADDVADEEELMVSMTLNIPESVLAELQNGNRFVLEIAQATSDSYEYEFRLPLSDLNLTAGDNVIKFPWSLARETSDAKGTGTPSLSQTMNYCKLYYQDFDDTVDGIISLQGVTIKELKVIHTPLATGMKQWTLYYNKAVTTTLFKDTEININLGDYGADVSKLSLYVKMTIPETVAANTFDGTWRIKFANTVDSTVELGIAPAITEAGVFEQTYLFSEMGNSLANINLQNAIQQCRIWNNGGSTSISGVVINEMKIIYTE